MYGGGGAADQPRGPFKFDSYGNPIDNMYIFKIVKKNGKTEKEVIQTIPNISQFWKYDPEKYMQAPEYSRSYPSCKYCSDK